ncbi:hypothetical protein EG68_00965 [Paragonimus skrjabini miyazakii]|uniref:Uncharacterized protein n=1 Tax=Paragonimus skrjabini miyazakii TaxID=59628 RepID=A0A8S9ZBY3_9TREM|nr:hypothetical protein EG68_00965 [Paragonimus skrjabini miyazakii]
MQTYCALTVIIFLLAFSVICKSDVAKRFNLGSLGDLAGGLTGSGNDKFGLDDIQCMTKIGNLFKKNKDKFSANEQSSINGLLGKLKKLTG